MLSGADEEINLIVTQSHLRAEHHKGCRQAKFNVWLGADQRMQSLDMETPETVYIPALVLVHSLLRMPQVH